MYHALRAWWRKWREWDEWMSTKRSFLPAQLNILNVKCFLSFRCVHYNTYVTFFQVRQSSIFMRAIGRLQLRHPVKPFHAFFLFIFNNNDIFPPSFLIFNLFNFIFSVLIQSNRSFSRAFWRDYSPRNWWIVQKNIRNTCEYIILTGQINHEKSDLSRVQKSQRLGQKRTKSQICDTINIVNFQQYYFAACVIYY